MKPVIVIMTIVMLNINSEKLPHTNTVAMAYKDVYLVNMVSR